MARRQLLTDQDRAALFGVPTARDALAKLYTLDAALGMADRLIGASFTRGNNARERTYTATSRDVGRRLMRLLHGTAAAVEAALRDGSDVAAAIDGAVGLDRLVRSASQAAAIAELAEEDPLVRAADRWQTLRKFAPLLLEAIDFKAARAYDRTVAALDALREHYRSGRCELPRNVPMPFKKEWRKLVVGAGGKVDRRLFETALFAHVRNKLRAGEVWVERSDGYRRFDSYLLPLTEAAPIAAGVGLPATADEWLAAKADALDRRLRRLAHRLPGGKLEGVVLRDGRLSIAPVRAAKSAEADVLADEIGALMPRSMIFSPNTGNLKSRQPKRAGIRPRSLLPCPPFGLHRTSRLWLSLGAPSRSIADSRSPLSFKKCVFYSSDLPEELRAVLAATGVAPQSADLLDGNRRRRVGEAAL